MAHPKGLLMERLKKQGVEPEFRTANTGPEHEPTFLSDVVVNGEVYGTGQGNTKREAERLAAEEALAYIDRNPLELEGPVQKPARSKTKSRSKPKSAEEQPAAATSEAEERFDGPWPVFEHLLAGVVEVAGERVDESLTGEEARQAVRDFTLELYKELLEELGDVVEEDDEG